MMNELLRELIGHQVQVYSVRGETEISDVGILEGYDDTWVCLRKEQVRLYFSIYRIRLVKLL